MCFFLYFDLYGYGKLDLKLVHGRAESVLEATRFVQKRCTATGGRAPPKTAFAPLKFSKNNRKNNRNNSPVFKNNGLLSFAPPPKKNFFPAESEYHRPKWPRKIIEPRVLEKQVLFICGHT